MLSASYEKLLLKILESKVYIKSNPSLPLNKSTYYRKWPSKNGLVYSPRIHIGGRLIESWVEVSTAKQFVQECKKNRLVNEISILAHEFGHHFSDFEEYEDLMTDYKKDPNLRSVRTIWKLMREEAFAWNKGEIILKEVHSSVPFQFHIIKIYSLSNYLFCFIKLYSEKFRFNKN